MFLFKVVNIVKETFMKLVTRVLLNCIYHAKTIFARTQSLEFALSQFREKFIL